MSTLKALTGPPRLAGRDFSDEEILHARDNRRLLRVNIEIAGNECPLRCTYCYSNSGPRVDNTLTHEQILQIIDAAVDLGARTVVLTGGGEPLVAPTFKEIVQYIAGKTQNGAPVTPLVFTGGTLVEGMAGFLFDNNVTIVTKLNSPPGKPDITDELSGTKGAHKDMLNGIEALMKAGYPGPDPRHPRLGVESVITNRNYDCLPDLWQWIRQRGLYPYIELTKLMGRARWEDYIRDNCVTLDDARRLFDTISEIDKNEFGFEWEATPPIMADRCAVYYYSCYVDMFGNICPCSGVPVLIGRVSDPGGLAAVVESNDFHQQVRCVGQKLLGRCKRCPRSFEEIGCYGCRAHAYWHDDPGNYNYLDEDPLCWRWERPVGRG